MLNLVSTEVFRIDCYTLQDLIQEQLGQEYCFVAALECGNEHTEELCDVDGTDYDEEDITAFLEGNYKGQRGYPWPSDIMEYLVHKELIPPGTYEIDCSW